MLPLSLSAAESWKSACAKPGVSMLPAARTTRVAVRCSKRRAASRSAAAVPIRMARSELRSKAPRSSCAKRFKMTGTVVATVILALSMSASSARAL